MSFSSAKDKKSMMCLFHMFPGKARRSGPLLISIKACWGMWMGPLQQVSTMGHVMTPTFPCCFRDTRTLCLPFHEREGRKIRLDRVTVTSSTAISRKCNSDDSSHMPSQRRSSDTSHRSPSAFLQQPNLAAGESVNPRLKM